MTSAAINNHEIPSLHRYEIHLRCTAEWLLRSLEHGKGGSCAHFSPVLGWSKPYPETTGYLIPTLLALPSRIRDDDRYVSGAKQLGEWLLKIQNENGSWHGGLHPNPNATGSVFNTGQILKGMMALFRTCKDERYLEAARRGAHWLTQGVSEAGLWQAGDYRASETPSYYTHVAWPMLEVWSETRDDSIRFATECFLQRVIARIKSNGAIAKWGFGDSDPAFTHTIAYTIRGFQECARLLDNYEKYGRPVEPALEVFIKKAELRNGRLPGEFDEEWRTTGNYVCLTGNAQLAICMLLLEQRQPDLRIVNAAAKLVDFVESTQRTTCVPEGMRGAVAGSYPLWGRYMRLRYPNWAAKYYCDALILLMNRIEQELSDATSHNSGI